MPGSLISAGFISMITSVPTSIAKELIQGLKYDLPANDEPLRKLIPQTLIKFDDAVKETLADEAAALDNKDWGYSPAVRSRWKPGYGYYPKNAGYTVSTPASAASLGIQCNKSAENKAIFMVMRYGKYAPLWMISLEIKLLTDALLEKH